ncbi:hypothetical protein Agau_C202186 [Agrobacterium tumefaciens F2]|nr:hypothetical protein Agau_C202186 [Agrobacterium tumefaciens F2]
MVSPPSPSHPALRATFSPAGRRNMPHRLGRETARTRADNIPYIHARFSAARAKKLR